MRIASTSRRSDGSVAAGSPRARSPSPRRARSRPVVREDVQLELGTPPRWAQASAALHEGTPDAAPAARPATISPMSAMCSLAGCPSRAIEIRPTIPSAASATKTAACRCRRRRGDNAAPPRPIATRRPRSASLPAPRRPPGEVDQSTRVPGARPTHVDGHPHDHARTASPRDRRPPRAPRRRAGRPPKRRRSRGCARASG